MRAPAFWRDRGLAARLLAPLGSVYGAVTSRRMHRAGEKAPVPVVCVGNFVAGGAGKTPTAIAVADLLKRQGRRPVFLSRGYGGRVREPTRVDVNRHRADLTGDEPLLLARHAPTVVSPDRIAGAQLAAALGDVIVMDDGLQNPGLTKDFKIAVVDGAFGVGNGLCLPAGPLRAPLDRQLAHVDAVLVIGQGSPGDRVAEAAEARSCPVLRGALVPDAAAVTGLEGRGVLAFAGIGRPEKLFETLEDAGVRVVERQAFPDHHPFTRSEIAGLLARARAGALALVTTEKDRVRMTGVLAPGEDAFVRVLPVRLRLRDEALLADLLGRRLGSLLRPSA